MADGLSQQLAHFQQRQERSQARSASDAAARARGPVPKQEPRAMPVEAKGGSWLDNQEHFQQIIRIQNLPIGLKLKKVIELLEERREALTPSDIKDSTYIDISGNKDLQTALKSNPKIAFDGARFRFKATHELSGRVELLRLIRDHKDGIPFAQVADSYAGVASDVQELRSQGHIWVLQNSDSQKEVLYPDDPRIRLAVDEDVRALLRGVELPRERVDLERELRRAGVVPAGSAAQRQPMLLGPLGRQAARPRPRKPRESKRARLTNSHLPELLEAIQMASLERS